MPLSSNQQYDAQTQCGHALHSSIQTGSTPQHLHGMRCKSVWQMRVPVPWLLNPEQFSACIRVSAETQACVQEHLLYSRALYHLVEGRVEWDEATQLPFIVS